MSGSDWIRLPAWSVFVLWIRLPAYRRMGTERRVISSVSSFAHLGGAAVGFIAWLVWRNKELGEEQTDESGRQIVNRFSDLTV